eukprot:8530969-Prorocentrum_lima.AAC.1
MKGQQGPPGDAWKDYQSGAWRSGWKDASYNASWRRWIHQEGVKHVTEEGSTTNGCLQVWGKQGSLEVCLHHLGKDSPIKDQGF